MGITVLSVEDDDAAFYILQMAFQEISPSVKLYRAVDGEEALTMLNKSGIHAEMPRPNLILLDLNLPKKSGLEVLQFLQTNSKLSAIPTVIFTSSSLDSERVRCLRLGAVDYITKPMSFNGVVQAVQSAYSRAAT